MPKRRSGSHGRHGVKIIINDRVDIALALGADGVHLGQDDLPPERGEEILGEDAIIGFSTHSLEQASGRDESAGRLHRHRTDLSDQNQRES